MTYVYVVYPVSHLRYRVTQHRPDCRKAIRTGTGRYSIAWLESVAEIDVDEPVVVHSCCRGMQVKDVARRLGVSESTVYRRKKRLAC